jgi:hypothetical protein
VRRLAYEASDCGRLSTDWAAGIGRIKGVQKLGFALAIGQWQSKAMRFGKHPIVSN